MGNCTVCPVGTFSNTSDASTCTACRQGTFASSTNTSACSICAPGTSNSLTGNTACATNCSAGYYQDGSLLECTVCPAGTYINASRASACLQCAAGKTTSTTGSTYCDVDCTAGTYQNGSMSSCANCPAGRINIVGNASSCTACPAGYTSTAGTTICTSCAAGTFTAAAGTSSCSACALGTFAQYANSTTCAPCSAGFFAGSTSSTICAQCTAGTSTGGNTGASACTNCAAGSFSKTAAAPVCSLCAPNTYQTIAGSTACTNCDSGYVSAAGATVCTLSVAPTAAPTAGPSLAPTVAPTFYYTQPVYPAQAVPVTVSFSGSNVTTGSFVVATSDFVGDSVSVTVSNGGTTAGAASVRPVNPDELLGTAGDMPLGMRRLAGVAVNSTLTRTVLAFDLSGMPFTATGKRLFAIGATAGASAQDAVALCGGTLTESVTGVTASSCLPGLYAVAMPLSQKLYCQAGMTGCSCRQTGSKRSNTFQALAWIGAVFLALGCLVRAAISYMKFEEGDDATSYKPLVAAGATTTAEGSSGGGKLDSGEMLINIPHVLGVIFFTCACTFAIAPDTIDTYTGPNDDYALRQIFTALYDDAGRWWAGAGWVSVIAIGVIAFLFRLMGWRRVAVEERSPFVHGELAHVVVTGAFMIPLAAVLLQSPRQGVAYLAVVPPVLYLFGVFLVASAIALKVKVIVSIRSYQIAVGLLMAAFYLTVPWATSELPCGSQYKPRSYMW